jgi:DNA-binding transcriptional ArsR family regulator
MSRPAVSRHLRVLRRARLVDGSQAGRERWYRLNPRPLRAMEGWLRHYETLWTERLHTLKQLVEDTERGRKGERGKR